MADTQLITVDVEELLRQIRLQIRDESSAGIREAVRFHETSFPGRGSVSNEEEFREDEYLALNPDVAEAVRRGSVESGRAHWLAHGRLEGRRAGKSITASISRLHRSDVELQTRLSEIGEPPPSPGTWRARISRRIILAIGGVMWWYTRSLQVFGDVLHRQARDYADMFEQLVNAQEEQSRLVLAIKDRLKELETGLRSSAETAALSKKSGEALRGEWDRKAADFAVSLGRIDGVSRELTAKIESGLGREMAAREALAERLASLHDEFRQIRDQCGGLQRYSEQARVDLAFQAGRINMFLEEARRLLPGPLGSAQPECLTAGLDAEMDRSYVAFENTFRGSRDEVKRRHGVYLPFITAAQGGSADRPIVDLGCGRGEWLELLRENRLIGRGVDRNGVMLQLCRQLALEVVEGDALSYLRTLQGASAGAITSFHMIEHLPFASVMALLDEALRVLKPGGLLILETPNPCNVSVATHNFYLDPTHLKPIPAAMLRFFVEAKGFCNSQALDLHPYPAALIPPTVAGDATAQRLNELFYGPQDYAIIAERP